MEEKLPNKKYLEELRKRREKRQGRMAMLKDIKHYLDKANYLLCVREELLTYSPQLPLVNAVKRAKEGVELLLKER